MLVEPKEFGYKVLCDQSRHTVLHVEEKNGKVAFISKQGKEVGFHHWPSKKFHDLYSLEYLEYPLHDYARRTLNLRSLGVVINTMARRHLDAILSGEYIMAKPTAPVSTKAAPVADPKAKKGAAPAAEKPAKEPKAPKAEGEGGTTRERREKLDGGAKIKVIGKNPARVGSVRHAIVETIFKARTVAEALDSSVQRKDGSDYKIGTPDLYFALENELITIG